MSNNPYRIHNQGVSKKDFYNKKKNPDAPYDLLILLGQYHISTKSSKPKILKKINEFYNNLYPPKASPSCEHDEDYVEPRKRKRGIENDDFEFDPIQKSQQLS